MKDTNNDILYRKIIVGEFKIPSFVSDKARDLIKRILNTDPSQRFNIKQIKAHPWLNIVKLKPNEGLFISVHKIPVFRLSNLD
jgi:serine/threonine protein kinase